MPKKKTGPPWTPEAVAAEAKRYRTRTEFHTKACGAYEAAVHRYGILDEVCAHMVPARELRLSKRREELGRAVQKCKTFSEFSQKHRSVYRAILRNGWNELLENLPRAHTRSGWWTLERVAEEAKKHKTRTAFSKDSAGAYTTAWTATR